MGMKRGEKGNVAVLVAVGMAFLIGSAALAVDVAEAYRVRNHLEDVATLSALAGAQVLYKGESAARAAAEATAGGGTLGSEVDVTGVHIYVESSRPGGPKDQVRVKVEGVAYFRFAPALGYKEQALSFEAAARAGRLIGLRGVVPLGIPDQELEFGKIYQLKSDNPMVPGNFGALAPGDRGASEYEKLIAEGYDGYLQVGDRLYTEPGNMKGPTKRGIQARIAKDPDATCQTVKPNSPRIIYVPVVDFSKAKGRSEVPILGFAAFFLIGTDDGSTVTGCFLQMVAPGDWGGLDEGRDYGTYGVGLVR
ncbi:MAG: Tad domain-containing protein [Clostridiales bacterium]|nr:Tad domain-containing protein [Clostridiales bacterium]